MLHTVQRQVNELIFESNAGHRLIKVGWAFASLPGANADEFLASAAIRFLLSLEEDSSKGSIIQKLIHSNSCFGSFGTR